MASPITVATERKGAPILTVVVHGSTGLRNADPVGKSDPYVKVQILDSKGGVVSEKKSLTVNNNLSPKWDFKVDFSTEIASIDEKQLRLSVWDYDINADDFLGQLTFELSTLDVGKEQHGTAPLNDKNDERSRTPLGEIEATIHYSSGRAKK